MVSGTLTMACVLMAANAGTPDAVHLNERNFQIPLRIEEARRPEIKQVILWVSLDGGKAWDQTSTVTPDKDGFNYYAPADGLYLFKVQIEDQQGNKQPGDIYKAPVGQRIVVDTLRPQVQITAADRQANEVSIRWDIKEDNPDLPTLKLECRAADAPAGVWSPVNITPALTSQASFKVNTAAAMSVRMQIMDLAGNSGSATAEVVAASPTSSGNPIAAGPRDNSWSPTQPVSLTKSPVMPRPDLADLPPAGAGSASWGSTNPVDSGSSGNQLVASTMTKVGGEQPGLPGAGRSPRGDMPRVQLVNSSTVTLQYAINKFGPSGVGSVELYVTRDDGQKWERFGEGQNLNVPIPADAGALAASVQRSLTVTLPGEGIYGFYLVVKSGAGLGKPPPKDGVTLPQMRIEVDETAPQANLYAPVPDAQQKDSLILTWTASDRNLADKPITLQWAERQAGPWEMIGAPELPNTGKFTWKVTSQVPPRVFLRLVVRDAAGNTAEAVTPQPILVDLNEPEAQFIGLSGSPQR